MARTSGYRAISESEHTYAADVVRQCMQCLGLDNSMSVVATPRRLPVCATATGSGSWVVLAAEACVRGDVVRPGTRSRPACVGVVDSPWSQAALSC